VAATKGFACWGRAAGGRESSIAQPVTHAVIAVEGQTGTVRRALRMRRAAPVCSVRASSSATAGSAHSQGDGRPRGGVLGGRGIAAEGSGRRHWRRGREIGGQRTNRGGGCDKCRKMIFIRALRWNPPRGRCPHRALGAGDRATATTSISKAACEGSWGLLHLPPRRRGPTGMSFWKAPTEDGRTCATSPSA